MSNATSILFICLTAFQAFAQSASKWQVGTITEVKIHQSAEKAHGSEAATYDVSVKVGDTIYVVLYTPPLREETVKYATGRELLVFVGKNTIRYNDILGQKSAVNPSPTKPVSREN